MNALDHHACSTAAKSTRGANPDTSRPSAAPYQHKSKLWDRRCERWGALMTAAQKGGNGAYDKLLRELDQWLRSYYARRLPPSSADDARQDALLAVHTSLHTYKPNKPFGPWVAAIARYKWIDHVREASRHATIPLDDQMSGEDREELFIEARYVDSLIAQLKPAQASVIRLIKLQGLTVRDASALTGQTSALVKVNVHRGLKTLSILAKDEDLTSLGSGTPRYADGSRMTNPEQLDTSIC
jgi:RNA polymerase sigma factor (sigma-70 family)